MNSDESTSQEELEGILASTLDSEMYIIKRLRQRIKELESEVTRLKAENEQLKNITLVSVEIES